MLAMSIVRMTLITIFSLLVLIRIRCFHKRHDFFFTLVPTLMILAQVFSIPLIIEAMAKDLSYQSYLYLRSGTSSCVYVLTGISTVAEFLATFVFAVQYLKTSVIFPKLVTLTKIERL